MKMKVKPLSKSPDVEIEIRGYNKCGEVVYHASSCAEGKYMKHKYADAIVAWAYGEPVQWRDYPNGPWMNFSPRTERSTPEFNGSDLEWRPTPKKKTGWITIERYEDGTFGSGRVHQSREAAAYAIQRADADYIACIQIEFEEGEGL